MRTLGQATNIQQTTLGSTGASLQTSRVAAQQNVAGNSLANDIMGIVGKTGQIAQEVNTLSVKAAQRVASDNKTSLAFRLNEIDRETNYNDPQSIREAQMANELAYQENGRKTFDNEDAQIAYDDGYHKSAAIGVVSTNTALEKKALTLDANNIFVNTSNGISEQLTAGIPIDKAEYLESKDAMTAGKYFEDFEADRELVRVMNNNVNNRFELRKDLPIYNADGSVNLEMEATEFNKVYGSIGSMNSETGVVTPSGAAGTDAMVQAQNNWKSLKIKSGDANQKHNRTFELSMNSTEDVVKNNSSTFTSAGDIEGQIKTLDALIVKSNEEKKLSDSQYTRYLKSRNDLLNQRDESGTITGDINDGDVDKVRGYLEDGRTMEVYDNNTGVFFTKTIKKEKYKAYVTKIQEDQSESLLSTDITDENQAEFSSSISKLKRFEGLTGTKSSFSDKYDGMYNPDKNNPITDVKSIKQSIIYHNEKAKTNPAYKKQRGVTAKIEAVIGKTDDKGEPIADNIKVAHVNNILEKEKRDSLSKKSNVTLVKEVDAIVLNIADGSGDFERFSNADIPSTVNSAIADDIAANGKQLMADEYIADEMGWVDYGNKLGFSRDSRIPALKGVESETMVAAIDAVRDNWNDKQNTDYDREEVSFNVSYDFDSDNYIIEVMNKNNSNEKLGEVNMGNVDILSEKNYEETNWIQRLDNVGKSIEDARVNAVKYLDDLFKSGEETTNIKEKADKLEAAQNEFNDAAKAAKPYAVDKELVKDVMKEENPKKVGYDAKTDTWKPYSFQHKAGKKAGKWEVDVGYGKLIGIYDTEEEAKAAMADPINNISGKEMTSFVKNHLETSAKALKGVDKKAFSEMPIELKDGIVKMMYQIGDGMVAGNKPTFKKMTEAINAKDWDEVIAQAKDSNWFKEQTPARAKRVIASMKAYKKSRKG